jgi:hypothetical protein
MAKTIEHITQQEMEQEVLTAEREQFCLLYVCGGMKFAGQLCKCYKQAFGEDYRDVNLDARRLVREPLVMARIRELSVAMTSETESIAIKMQISETLRAVMEETATGNFSDRFGNRLSPAPLRAVSVNAAKALMELYPVKHEHETKLKIEASDGGVVFNVIVPNTKSGHEDADPES